MTNRIRGDSEDNLSYWRDVGTVDSYYEANMDLRDARPQSEPLQSELAAAHRLLQSTAGQIRLQRRWAARAWPSFGGFRRMHHFGRHGSNSVLGRSVFVHSYSEIEESVIMDYLRNRARAPKFAARSSTRTSISPRATKSATTLNAIANVFRHRFRNRGDSQDAQTRSRCLRDHLMTDLPHPRRRTARASVRGAPRDRRLPRKIRMALKRKSPGKRRSARHSHAGTWLPNSNSTGQPMPVLSDGWHSAPAQPAARILSSARSA